MPFYLLRLRFGQAAQLGELPSRHLPKIVFRRDGEIPGRDRREELLPDPFEAEPVEQLPTDPLLPPTEQELQGNTLGNPPGLSLVGDEITRYPEEPTLAADDPRAETVHGGDVGAVEADELAVYDRMVPLLGQQSVDPFIHLRRRLPREGQGEDRVHPPLAALYQLYESASQDRRLPGSRPGGYHRVPAGLHRPLLIPIQSYRLHPTTNLFRHTGRRSQDSHPSHGGGVR